MGLLMGLPMGLRPGLGLRMELLLAWSKGGRPLRPLCGSSFSTSTVRRTTWFPTVNASEPAASAETGECSRPRVGGSALPLSGTTLSGRAAPPACETAAHSHPALV